MTPARTSAGVAGFAALLLITACTASPVASETPVPAAEGGDAASTMVTPLTLSAIGDPLVVAGSDGKQHVEYDILVTNVFTAPLTLTQVTVHDSGDASTVFQVSGDSLAAVTEENFIQRAVDPPAQIPVSAQVTVEVDAIFDTDAYVPTDLDHIISWSVDPSAPALSFLDGKTTGDVAGLPLAVSTIEPVIISAPLRGDGWWSLQGCCQPNGHRSLRYAVDGTREIKPELFAVDWAKLEDGAFFSGDGTSNDDYPYIGEPLYAVADGTIVHTRDGLPNEEPQQPPANVKVGKDYIGNSVVIQIAPDRFAVYGHMEAGSLRVKEGDTVQAGDVIGELGSSGNSTGAHLHFAITDTSDFLLSTSIPFVIDKWTLQGTAEVPDQPGPITVEGSSTPQTNTHPLWRSVADFGE